jgi:hypothetical protein
VKEFPRYFGFDVWRADVFAVSTRDNTAPFEERTMIARWIVSFATGLFFLVSGATFGGTVSITVGTPTVAKGQSGSYSIYPALLKQGKLKPIYSTTFADVSVNPTDTQTMLFNDIVSDLKHNFMKTKLMVASDPKTFTITISGLKAQNDLFDGVAIETSKAGIASTTIQAKDDPNAAFINWGTEPTDSTGASQYSLKDANGNTATFTAGVQTDLGSVVVTLPASAFPVSGSGSGQYIAGSDIAQVFYNELSPMVSNIGATVALNGAELDFSFLPGSASLTGGGIGGATVDFGTTSADGSITAGIDSIPTPEPGSLALLLSGLAVLTFLRRFASTPRRGARMAA